MPNDALGDRMKLFEAQETNRTFLPSLPIYARIDGRSFSKFTKNMQRPYDIRMSRSMINTTKHLVENTHATIGYVQSDEISLVWIPKEHGHAWFNGKITKMTSVLAGLASSAFMVSVMREFDCDTSPGLLDKVPHFDCRAISMPNELEAANMLLWRSLDCTKNSISMAASYYYSHKELQGKTGSDKQELLWKKGINFNDYPAFFKRGTFVRRENTNVELTKEELEQIPLQHRPSGPVIRTIVKEFDLPPLNKISNLAESLFHKADVIYRT